MSKYERKRYLPRSTDYPSTSKAARARYTAQDVQLPSVGGYGPCYPKINSVKLKVYMVGNEPRPELPLLEEKVKGGEILSMREFQSRLDDTLQKDCITLSQMVRLAGDRPMGAGIVETLSKLAADNETYTLYTLRSMPKMREAIANGDAKFSNVGNDPRSIDRFRSRSSFGNVASVAVALTSIAKQHWHFLNKNIVNKGNAFPLGNQAKQLTVLMVARICCANSCHFFDKEPKAVAVIPARLMSTVDSVLEDESGGNVKFDKLIKTVLKRLDMQEAGTGVERYLREYDWSERSARLVQIGARLTEKEIDDDDQPPERRTAVASGVDDPQLRVLLRRRCRVRKCNRRFKNEYNRMQHMEREHLYTMADVKQVTDVDVTERSRMYQIVDEHTLLRQYPFLEDETEAAVHPDFTRRSTEFCEVHTENLFRLTTIENELVMWKKVKNMDEACRAQRRWREEMLEEGKRLVLDDDRFNAIMAMSTAVSRRRIDENRTDTNFLSNMKKTVEDNPMVKLMRMNESDFDQTVSNNDGYDMSALTNKTLGYDGAILQANARRAAQYSFRLINAKLDPEGEIAVTNAKRRLREQYGGGERFSEDEEEEEEEEEEEGEEETNERRPGGGRGGGGGGGDGGNSSGGGAVSTALAVMNPTAIRVHRLDAFKGIKTIVDEVMDPRVNFGHEAAGQVLKNIVNFTRSKFKLSEAGRKAAFDYCYGQLRGIFDLSKDRERRQAVVKVFSDVFRFFNSNQTGRLNNLFAKRRYDRSDPYMRVVDVDGADSYETPVGGLTISMEYNRLDKDDAANASGEYAEEVMRFQRETCAICMYEFGCRSLEALPCKAIALAESLGESAPNAQELIRAANDHRSRGEEADWNGAHIFHKSCYREMIRNRAKDTRMNSVECPKCRTVTHDAAALNVIRMKLVKANFEGNIDEFDDDVFDVKSELGRPVHFLVSCQQDLDRLKESVRKLLKQKDMNAGNSRTDATNRPYEIGPLSWYTDTCDDVEEDVDKFIAKLKTETIDERRARLDKTSYAREEDYPPKTFKTSKDRPFLSERRNLYGSEDYTPTTPVAFSR